MHSILEFDGRTLQNWLKFRKEPSFRKQQIENWIFSRRATCFAEMSNLPKTLRQLLEQEFTLWNSTIVDHQKATDGTEKLLLELADGGRIECVLIRDGKRCTVCISTQVGCAMGCVFCASGLNGVERNLTTLEIVEQILQLQLLLKDNERISHVVVMGMGEPLANLDQLLPALDIANCENRFGISARRITISTVGLPPAIFKLARLTRHYHLAISLHAPNDKLRNELVPVNDKIGIQSIMDAAQFYFDKSGRRLTFEYVLLAGINDSPQQAHQLAGLLRNVNALLNVIPYNPVDGLPYATPSAKAVGEFREVLLQQGVILQFRQKKGDEINAACGQLRRNTPKTHSIDLPSTV